jgi:tetratricopeptide (TPR) repeat protein
LSRLDTALDISASSREVPSRQKTLRDTIGWSHDLLDERQQRFFRSLGVFAGGADLDAVQAVTADALDGADPLDLVADLVDASLLTISESSDGEPRIGMLETIRAYAREKLREAAELDELGVRHAHYYLALGESFRDMPWLQARANFETEHDNFREVLRWARSPAGTEKVAPERGLVGLRLCIALGLFWQASGYLREARGWLEGAVHSVDDTDRPELADCLRRLANVLRFVGDLEPAHRYATESVAMCRRLHDGGRLALSLVFLAAVEAELELSDGPRALYEEALGLARECGDKATLSFTLTDFAYHETSSGHYEQALAMQMEGMAIARALGDSYRLIVLEQDTLLTLRLMGRHQEAYEQLVDLIPRLLEVNNSLAVTDFAEDCAAVLAALQHSTEAVRLLGAAEERRERLGTPRSPDERRYATETVERTRQYLTEHDWDEAYRSGRNATVEDTLRGLHLQAQAGRIQPRSHSLGDKPIEPGRG